MKNGASHVVATPYRVEFHPTAAALPEALWAGCFPPPHEGRWWYETLERSGLDEQFTFFYGLVAEERTGRPVGIAPAFAADVPLEELAPDQFQPLLRVAKRLAPTLLRQRTLFVGSPCVDEGRVGFIPGVDRRGGLLAVQTALERKAKEIGASMIVWKDCPGESAEDFDWLARRRRLFGVPSLPGAVASLPTARKEDYFAALKGSRRHNLKKKLRLGRQRAELDAAIVTRPDARTLDEMFGLFWQTYQRSANKFERLDRAFFEHVAVHAPTRFVTLRERAGGELVAFALCFAMGERLVNKFVGLDYARPREWLLYFRLWEATLDHALSGGFAAISSGQLAYLIKIEMGHELVPLDNYCQHRNPALHQLYRFTARTITWASLDAGLASFLKAHPQAAARMDPPPPEKRTRPSRGPGSRWMIVLANSLLCPPPP